MTPEETLPTVAPEPTNAPGRSEVPVEVREGADVIAGSNEFVSWGAYSDVGLVRGHNEDSFLIQAPLFVVSDGMGGHAAGEVASSIAIETIGQRAPGSADDVLLGAAVEAANQAVIAGAEAGVGKPGMGCTASAVLIEKDRMAVAHVGDSRVYVLHHGTLVRITHDHSYVEELVDAGQITADEARTHPSRSIITRALGSDPDMYADHFSLEVNSGDRVILCSDGLSSMVPDSEIEALAVSSATPRQAAGSLVAAALTAGGADNVTVVVVDVLNDGLADEARRQLTGLAARIGGALAIVLAVVAFIAVAFIRSEWYLGTTGDVVGIYRGIKGDFLGVPLSELVSTSAVEVSDLPTSLQDQLEQGIRVQNEQAAQETIDSYHTQIDEARSEGARTADEVRAGTDPDQRDGAGTTVAPDPDPTTQNGGE